jgi:hypothetical protein
LMIENVRVTAMGCSKDIGVNLARI